MKPAVLAPRSLLVVIPALNAERTLAETLESLNRQEGLFEAGIQLRVLVVDNGSTDRTALIAETFASAHPLQVLDVRDIRGASHAMNVAAKSWSGDLLMFVAADDIVNENYVKELATVTRSSRIGIPVVIPASRRQPPMIYRNPTQQTEPLQTVVIAGPDGRRIESVFFYNAFMISTRDFARLGGFDASLRAGEDLDFAIRASIAGLAPVLSTEAKLTYYLKATAAGAFRTGRSAGIASRLVARKYRRLYDMDVSIKSTPRQAMGALRRLIVRPSTSNLFRAAFASGRYVGGLEGLVRRRPPLHH